MDKIAELTEEQEALLPIYRKKWQKIAFSTEPIDKDKITSATKQVYAFMAKPEPIITFCTYPNLKEEILFSYGLNSFGLDLNTKFADLLIKNILEQINKQFSDFLVTQIKHYKLEIISIWDLFRFILKSLAKKASDIYNHIKHYILPYKDNKLLVEYGVFIDFCTNVLDFKINKDLWKLFLDITNNCSQIMLYENICFICDRPITSISVDEENNLHCDLGKPSLKFTSGFEIYAYEGQIIPKQYGRVAVDYWQPEWLLEEDDLDLKSLLIRVMGEEKIYEELKTTERINKAGILTSKQKELILEYQYKWQQIAISTDKTDEFLVKKYVNIAYKYLKIEEPEVLFFDSPYAAQKYAIENKLKSHLRKYLEDNIYESLEYRVFYSEIEKNEFYSLLFYETKNIISQKNEVWLNYIYSNLFSSIRNKVKQEFKQFIKCIRTEKYIVNASIVDYLISVLNYPYNKELLEIFIGLVKYCGWIYPYRNVCLVSRSPIKLHLNDNLELHAIAKPAISFADGFSSYAYEGAFLPDKYCALHPDRWNSQWILEEEDIDLRYALIKGIGYDRISKELTSEIIETSEEYGLLRLPICDSFEWVKYPENDSDLPLPIQILKMPDPKTKKIITLRVPSKIDSIEKAIVFIENNNYY